jgi:hypothetical protein
MALAKADLGAKTQRVMGSCHDSVALSGRTLMWRLNPGLRPRAKLSCPSRAIGAPPSIWQADSPARATDISPGFNLGFGFDINAP